MAYQKEEFMKQFKWGKSNDYIEYKSAVNSSYNCPQSSLVILYKQLKAVFLWQPISFLEQVETCKVVSRLARRIGYLQVYSVRTFIALRANMVEKQRTTGLYDWQ